MYRKDQTEPATLAAIRNLLLIMLIASLIGTTAELLLIGHIKPLLQLVPVLLVLTGLVTVVWYGVADKEKALRVLQGTMVLCIASGLIGIFVHIAASASDAQKKDKTLQGMALLRAAVTGVAPLFAPGVMIQIGVIGLAYTYKHPVLEAERGRKARGYE